MARKRMLDPNIWVSEDMAMLSIFARLMFIGMISNADDEGKGRANVAYLKSTIFPYDEDITTRKVNEALKSIAEHCSVEIYVVDGKQYYRFKNWKSWQKVEKPSPSQIPNPTQQFGEQSGNSRGIVGDESCLIRKEKNINNTHKKTGVHAPACDTPTWKNNKTLSVFIERTGLSDTYWLDGFDYEAIANEISLSKKFLQTVTSFTFFVNNYDKVVSGSYRDFKESHKRDKNSIHFANERSYTKEELAGMITDVDEIDI